MIVPVDGETAPEELLRPDVAEVVTRNAERNAAMLAVDRKLGFVPTVTLTSAVVTL